MEKLDPIISFIKSHGILDEQTLDRAIAQQQKTNHSLINILKKENMLDEDQLTRVIAATNNIEFINLSPDMVEPKVARLVSYKIASRHTLIPVKKHEDQLQVAMSSPLNLSVRDLIEKKTGYRVVPVAAMPSAIKRAIRYHFSLGDATEHGAFSTGSLENDDQQMTYDSDQSLENMLDDTTGKTIKTTELNVTKVVSSLIRGALDAGASDIHIEPRENDVKVRYRIDGILQDVIKLPHSTQSEVVSHIKIMAEMDISQRRIPQDGHMSLPHAGRKFDLRVSSLPAVGGEKIVLRILDQSTDKWSLDKIATSPGDNQNFRKMVKNPYGLLLLTGPTGSGKTTTLYSILELLNEPGKNIVTVEDPVEYFLEGVTQVQVNNIAGITFASTLRSVLRQDPDIILVGEIRDLETAEIAVSAALTGHLVLSTLHTNDAVGAISRLINIGIPSFLVASSLLGTVAQRLIRTICNKCKESYKPPDEELAQLAGLSGLEPDVLTYKGAGCHTCYHSGYYGRKAIYEMLSVTPKIRKMIIDKCNDNEIKQQAIAEGMKTLRKSGLNEVLNGTTTIEELSRLLDMRAE